MAMTRAEISDQLASKTESLGYEWVGCDWSGAQTNVTLRIYIDHPEGVSIDACAQVSRELSTFLDVMDAMSYRYVLEVSSPGVERPLFTPAHFKQQLGKRVKLSLQTPDVVTGRKRFQGVIHSVEDDTICLMVPDEGEVTIQHPDIAKASLMVDFSFKRS